MSGCHIGICGRLPSHIHTLRCGTAAATSRDQLVLSPAGATMSSGYGEVAGGGVIGAPGRQVEARKSRAQRRPSPADVQSVCSMTARAMVVLTAPIVAQLNER